MRVRDRIRDWFCQPLVSEIQHMAETIDTAIAALKDEVTKVETDVLALVQAQQAALADLKAQLAAAATDMTPQIAAIDAMTDDLKAFEDKLIPPATPEA